MKPISLEICGWGPYGTKQNIDFTRLNDAGIFLISGNTGAGKTTIFDAITYALYGNVSGSFRKKDCLRSDYADDTIETYVELEFVHIDTNYVIKRNPPYKRKKLRGEGYTDSKEEAVLTMPDNSVIIGNNEVNCKIEEILGISYSQYKKISMIAQGEFQNILSEQSEKRVESFRNIFNTYIYDEIQSVSSELYRNIDGELKEIFNYISNILEVSGINSEEALLYNGRHDYEQLLFYIDEEKTHNEILSEAYEKEITEHNLKLSGIEKTISQENDKIDRLQKATNLEEEIVKLNEDIQKATLEYDELKEHEEEYKHFENKLADAIRIKPLFDLIAENKKNIEGINRNIYNLNAGLELEINKVSEKTESIDAINAFLTKNNNIDELIAKNKIELEGINHKIDLVNDAKYVTEKSVKAKTTYDTKAKTYIEQKDITKSAKIKYLELQEAYKDGMIGIVARKYLVENEPCPVCGSISHPNVVCVEVDIPSDEEVEIAKNDYEAAVNQENKLYSDTADAKSIYDSYIAQIKDLYIKLECDEHSFRDISIDMFNAKNHIVSEGKDLTKVKTEVTENIKKLDTFKNDINKITERINSDKEKINSLNVDMATFKTLIDTKQKEIPYEFVDVSDVDIYIKNMEDRIKSYKVNLESTFTIKQALINKFNENRAVIENIRKENVLSDEACLKKLNEDKSELTLVVNNCKEKKQDVDIMASQLQEALKKIKEKYIGSKKLWEEYSVMLTVSDLFNGKNANNIKLEHYVMSSYFDKMIDVANQRLSVMSNGNYRLYRVGKVSDARKKNVLDLEVLDNQTGRRRLVNTLSGGEQFQVALSMALGMSDIIQSSAGGIEVDVMFIDEGFASLDSGARQLAIDTLMKLTKDDMVIGVISHVDELKDRIDAQILINKGVAGSCLNCI